MISTVNSEEVSFEKKTQGHVTLKNFIETTNNIHEFAPDILLVQLGNYEFSFSIKQELFSLLKFKKKKVIRKSSINTPVTSKAGIVSPPQYIKLLIKSWIKIALDASISLTKKKMQVRKAELKQLLDILDQLNYNIILLSPFPVLERFVQKKRGFANKILEDHEFRNKKIRYVDTRSLVPQKRRYFQDSTHLNKEGHSRLANRLQSVFNELCELNQSHTVTT